MFAKMKEAKILFGKKLFKEAEDEYYTSAIFFHDLIPKDKFFARKCTRNLLNCSICCLKQAEKSTNTEEQIKLIEKSLFCSQEVFFFFFPLNIFPFFNGYILFMRLWLYYFQFYFVYFIIK